MPKFHKSRTVLPPGDYEVRVASATDKVSANENEMIVLRLSVEGHPQLFSDHLVFTESSSWKIAQFLTAMGEEVADDVDIHAADYVGRCARALIGVEEFNGIPKNRIEKWLSPAKTVPAAEPSPSLRPVTGLVA